MPAEATSPQDPVAVEADGPPRGRPHRVPVLVLCLVVGGAYLLTMHPGVGRGDSAGLQYAAAVLGLCYPPGYLTEVLVGKLFCLVPVGPDPAWRMNLMSVVFGVTACLALYAVVWRLTARVLPSVVAALMLAFSSIFWSLAIIAEVYVFYATFLILGIYCCVRFVQGGRRAWLYLMALALGFSIGGRPCELAVLPAFVPVWVFSRRKVRLHLLDAAVCGVLFVLPFCLSVGGYLVHYAHPSSAVMRDDILGEQIRAEALSLPFKEPSQRGLRDAVVYSLGLIWADQKVRANVVAGDLWQYVRMLLGLNLWDRLSEVRALRFMERESGIGISMGVLGMALAVWGTVAARRQHGWVLLGWGLFAGNLCYTLYNHRVDSRTFVIPGLVGLSVLAGFGAGAVPWGRWSARGRRAWPIACLVVPVILLAANWAKVDRNGKDDGWWVQGMHRLAEGPVPQGTAFVMTSWPGNTCRYLFGVWVDRPDVTVVNVQKEWMSEAVAYFLSRNRPVVIPGFHLRDEDAAQRLLDQAPVWMSDLGLIVVPPNASVTNMPRDAPGE